MFWKSLVIVFVVLFGYILLGSVIFHFLEHPHESGLKNTTFHTHMHFLSNNTCLDQDDLEEFVKNVLEAYSKGVTATANYTSESNWDFSSSFFFSATVVTTIGYGNIAPNTLGGQIFCIFYALAGIPLCTVFMASVGQKLRYPIDRIHQKMAMGRTQIHEKCIKVLLCLFIGDVLLILLPSLMFSLVEGWHYGVAVYYSVITLTTIGFGDYVAGLQQTPYRMIYRVVNGIWVMFGLAWVALIIGELSGDLTNKIATKERECKAKHISKKEDAASINEEVEMTAIDKEQL